MPILDCRLAAEDDDADLRRLLRENALPGEIALSYEREPSYWAARGIDGSFHQTLIFRAGEGRAVGMGRRSVRTLYVNGAAQPVGYMSQMRVDHHYAWGMALPRALAQGWRFYRRLHEDGRTPYYLVSLVAGDSVAWRMMTLGLSDWPTLHPVGGLLTYGIRVHRARAMPRLARGIGLRRATAADRGAIAECLARNGQRRQFSPVWAASELGCVNATPGLAMPDFWIAEQGSDVIGTLARWNQRDFKQQIVRGYEERLLIVRPFVNLAAKLGLAPRLPAVGEQVRLSFASHLAVDNDDAQVASALLAAVYNDAVSAGDDYLMLGLDSEHSFTQLARRYRRVVYATQLFLAAWDEDVEAARQVRPGQVGAEIALL